MFVSGKMSILSVIHLQPAVFLLVLLNVQAACGTERIVWQLGKADGD
jgi:hypothetical protein